jgi:hypothetical protein
LNEDCRLGRGYDSAIVRVQVGWRNRVRTHAYMRQRSLAAASEPTRASFFWPRETLARFVEERPFFFRSRNGLAF